MIIFLYGQDTYRAQQKLNEIIEHYKKIHKNAFSLRNFEGGNLNFQDFRNEVETISMFREKKLVVLKDVFPNQDFQEEFLKRGERFVSSDNIILIYEKKELDKNAPFFRFLKKKATVQEFQPLGRLGLQNWVKREFKKYQAKLAPEALELLVNYVGDGLWQMEGEIKKLVNYKNGQTVKKEDVELLVRPKIETDIFKTIDAIVEKRKGRALTLIHQHLEKGDAPLYLLAMINFQLRNLLMVKSGAKLNIHPYVVRKTIQQARAFSLEKLKKIYQKIFQVDYQIKKGRIEPETGLDMLIAKI